MTRLTKKLAAALAGAALLAQPAIATACTSIFIKTGDGGYVYGRTMEFGVPLNSRAIVIPRNLEISGTGPDGKAGSGLHWKGKYGVIGLNAFGLPVVADGMNERGLVGGLLYLPALAQFQEVSAAEAKQSIASFELLTYLLTSFATVDEVKENLPKIRVNRADLSAMKMPLPIHVTLHDARGASIVIEYIKGELNIHDNPTGVLTNAPAFDWHLANLGQYANLNPSEPQPLKVGDLTLSAPSTGAGLHGLPGDVLSPSRFVRAFFFSHYVPTPANVDEGVSAVRHIMNNFDIAPGAVVTSAASAAGGGVNGIEITEWTVYADVKNVRYYFTTYDNPALQVIDAAKVNLNATAPATFPITRPVAPLAIGQ